MAIREERGFIMLLSIIVGCAVLCILMSTMLRAIFTPPATTVIDNRTGMPVQLSTPGEAAMINPASTIGSARSQVEKFNATMNERMQALNNLTAGE
jgi:hypothetical protein